MKAWVTIIIASLSTLHPEAIFAQSSAKRIEPVPPANSETIQGNVPDPANGRSVTAAGEHKPADLCAEFLAFLRLQSSGVASPSEPAPQAATAAQAAPAPDPAGGPTQQASGLSGPIQPTGPDTSSLKRTTFGNSDLNADGRNIKRNSTSRQSAAVPPPETASQGKGPAPKVPSEPATSPIPYSLRPSMEQIRKAEAAALSRDLARCRSATQDMHQAGVKMPDGLLALAALDVRFFNARTKQ
jgi:hypothetical protein